MLMLIVCFAPPYIPLLPVGFGKFAGTLNWLIVKVSSVTSKKSEAVKLVLLFDGSVYKVVKSAKVGGVLKTKVSAF